MAGAHVLKCNCAIFPNAGHAELVCSMQVHVAAHVVAVVHLVHVQPALHRGLRIMSCRELHSQPRLHVYTVYTCT